MSTTATNVKTTVPRWRGRAGVEAKIAPLLIIAYWIASVFGHLEVSLWLVQRRESELLGSYKLADFLPYAGALLLTAVVIWQGRRAWRGGIHGATLAGWTVWLAAVIAADRFLIFSFPEYLHYPQYALLAFLIARFHDPDRTAFAIGPVLLAVTVLGIADEALQYTWITISYSNYLDFNDFLLNLLGGAAGLLLYYGFAPASQGRHSGPSIGVEDKTEPESSKQSSDAGEHKTTGSRITPRYARRFRDDEKGGHSESPRLRHPEYPRVRHPEYPRVRHPEYPRVRHPEYPRVRHPELDSGSSKQSSAAGRHKPTGSRVKPGMTIKEVSGLTRRGVSRMTRRRVSGLTGIRASTRYGLLGFTWLGTAMLLAVAVIKVTSTEPDRLQLIERQSSYNQWIPGPRAGRYYVLDPVTGTLILVGLGMLVSATPLAGHRTA